MHDTASTPPTHPLATAALLTRQQARRLRDIHRSAGWPSQDALEIELLAAGLLERVPEHGAGDRLRLTDTGIARLARALQRNRQLFDAHQALVARVARQLLRDGRLVWAGLALRARVPGVVGSGPAFCPPEDWRQEAGPDPTGLTGRGQKARPGPMARWRLCRPDLFSIRNTTVAAYLLPVVHEIKVRRADLLADLHQDDKRAAYLDLGGQCWYVLGSDARGKPIAQAHEVPASCGVMLALADGRLVVQRQAPQRALADLPFALWMALAKATPLQPTIDDDGAQGLLGEPARPLPCG